MDEEDVALIGRGMADILMLEKLFVLAYEALGSDRAIAPIWRADLEADAADRIGRMKDPRRDVAVQAAMDRIAEVFARIAPTPKPR